SRSSLRNSGLASESQEAARKCSPVPKSPLTYKHLACQLLPSGLNSSVSTLKDDLAPGGMYPLAFTKR
ncbi:MAG: hypothetical protein ACPHJW_09010, partial [Planctomycetota bacterium]